MILPDVNTLVYAFRAESEHHDTYHRWLSALLRGGEEVALPDHCLAGFVRIVTNPRIFPDPTPTPLAFAFTDRLRRSRRSRSVAATEATWELLSSWSDDDEGLRGNLVPDAYLAALAVTHGCRIATADRGFARFPKLDFFNPAKDATSG